MVLVQMNKGKCRDNSRKLSYLFSGHHYEFDMDSFWKLLR